MMNEHRSQRIPHVVVVGAGFGGLQVVRSLRRAQVRITLIDKSNHHLFQPLLYQVATAALSPADIAVPIRGILRKYPNVEVLLDEVVAVECAERRVHCRRVGAIEYDFLVLSPGAVGNYFGNERWNANAPVLKTLADALEIQRRILRAYEEAARLPKGEERSQWLTFVVVGGGPTGVEIAGALAEIGRFTMARDIPGLDPYEIRIVLIEAAERILPGFHHTLSQRAAQDLTKLHVEIRTGVRVTEVGCSRVVLDTGEVIPTRTAIWAAGTRAPEFLQTLGVPLDRLGRVIVLPDCTVPGYPEVFVIGDAACLRTPDGKEVPALAPAALQQGCYVAKLIRKQIPPLQRPAFRYRNKGMLATIGRARAVAALPGGLRLGGVLAWILWVFVHIFYLIRFRNRLAVMIEWMWYYLTYQPGARLLIEPYGSREVPDML